MSEHMSKHSIDTIRDAFAHMTARDIPELFVLQDAIDELAALRAWRDAAVPLLRGSQQALDVAIDAGCEECGIESPLPESQYESMRDMERDLRALLAESVAPHD